LQQNANIEIGNHLALRTQMPSKLRTHIKNTISHTLQRFYSNYSQ